MSQQAQAEAANETGRQSFAEFRAQATELRRQFEAEELSPEAFDAKLAELNAQREEFRRHFDAAAALNTLDRGITSLEDFARSPDVIRPQVDPGQPTPPQDDAEDTRAELTPQQPNRETLGPYGVRGLADLEPRARQLLNQYLRPHDGGRRGVEETYGRPQWEWLTGPRTARANGLQRRGEQLALNPYVDRAGGWVQADEIAAEVTALRSDATDIMSRVRTRTITAARLTLHHRNITVAFTKRGRGDGASVTVYDLSDVFSRTAVTPFAKDLIIQIPEEYFEDPLFDAVGAISEGIEEESREDDETMLLHGTGSGEALGIVTGLKALYTAGYTAAGHTIAGSGAAIAPADIQAHPHKLKASARRGAIWVGPRLFYETVDLFRTEEGGSGTGRFMYTEPQNAGQAPTLKGYPALESEFIQDKITTGVEGDAMSLFGNPSDYLWVIQKGLQLRILTELYAEKNMIGYKYVKKSDGCLERGDGWIFLRRNA